MIQGNNIAKTPGMKNSNPLPGYLRRFVSIFAGRMLGALLVFAINLLIARNMGPKALGTYAIFVALVAILTICLSLGFNSIASVFAAEYKSRNHEGFLKGYIRTALEYIFMTAGLLLVILLVSWGFSPRFLPRAEPLFGILVIITALGTAILNRNSTINVGLGRQVAGLLPETLFRPLLISLALLLLIDGLPNIYWVMALSAIATWACVLFVFFYSWQHFRAFSHVEARYEKKRWKNAAWPWLATSLLWDYMIDLILILTSILAGAIEIAILHVSFRYRVLAGFGMRTIYLLMLPEIAASGATGDKKQMLKKIARANHASLAYSLAVFLAFAIFGEWLLALFSSQFTTGLPVLLIISLTMLIRAVFGPASLVLAVNNLHLATAAISLFGLLLATMIIILFHGQFGLLAVATAYSLSNFMVSLLLWIYARNKTGINCSIFPLAGKPEKAGR